MILSPRSLKALEGVHEDLISVVRYVEKATKLDFIITQGLRTKDEQKTLVKKGLSMTMKSRHLTGHAFDFVPLVDGIVSWQILPFIPLIAEFKAAGKALRVPIESGGDWKSFKDYPHIQLPWKDYP